MSNSVPIHSVVASLSVIELLADAGEPVSVTSLAKSMNTNRPRIHRHLKTLEHMGYVRQDQSSRYYLTSKIRYIGQATGEIVELLSVARPHLIELRDRTRQSVTIGEVEAEGVRNLEILRAGGSVEITSRPGSFFELYSSAQGKIALAHGGDSTLATARWRASKNDDECDFDALESELATIRKRGWAVAPGTVLPGINALAAPILDGAGDIGGTISILGSIAHVAPEPAPHLIAEIQRAATNISSALAVLKKEGA